MVQGPRTDRAPRDPAFPLNGANIVVAVGGGIAAYKAAELVRLLDKAGATVTVAMTSKAQKFVGPMTFQALTRRPVFTDLFNLTEEATIGHIQLADDADLVIVAPATANVIARLAAGMTNDAVTAMVLATRAPVLLAPSMNVNMWSHPLTRANVQRLVDVARYQVVGPGEGFLACRWTGPGRLAEPADIVEAAAMLLSPQDLAGKKLVVSAGPTYEAIDPVRFVGNRSSGKMGIALAAAARRRGAEVTLILGPSAVPPPVGVTTSHVETAAQLQWALDSAARGADAIVMTAAVADYRPAREAKEKLKRGTLGAKTAIELVANPDVLAELGKARKGTSPLLVGFAAETEDVIENARKKLREKRCDLIVANDVSEPNAGFAVDTNHVQLVDASEVVEVPPAPKSEVAHRILDRIVGMLGAGSAPARPARPGSRAPGTSRTARGPRRRSVRAARRRPGR
ncbi:MAG TPA: bifunctional phosphopantothenoylcysteine decarboxylase/phosphopantothenate--cysteine ligase CoaBC [Kofleriaceae bacterium]|nr:bifunctional phosphopantothenoylcysteine decarboxylase/phosphopantothenate--cysteine ligase CoaBC [Kofleriaceae bacterium]